MPQNQNKVKSEYSKSFKTYRESAQAEYTENVKFRLARRNKEVSHQPWAWLDIDLNDSESDNNSIDDPVNTNSKKLLKVEHDNNMNNINNNSRCDSRLEDVNSNFDASGTIDTNACESDQDFIEHLKNKAIKRAIELKNNPANIKDIQSNQNNNTVRRPHHPLKGKSENSLRNGINNESNNVSKPPKNLRSVNREKMFLSYGWGSESAKDSHKRTFNIKSEIDVHPSAIRAVKTRENTKKQLKNRSNGGDSTRPMTADPRKRGTTNTPRGISIDNREAMEWLSEYQFRFPIYDNEVYKRGYANLVPRGQFARLDTPRTCRI